MMDRPDHPTLHFAEDEANAILRLAVELQERGVSVPDIRTGMSLKDLEHVASQIGVGPEFVREAATRITQPGPAQDRTWIFGSPTRFHAEMSLPAGIDWTDPHVISSTSHLVRRIMRREGMVRSAESCYEWNDSGPWGSARLQMARSADGIRLVADADRGPEARRTMWTSGLIGAGLLGLFAIFGGGDAVMVFGWAVGGVVPGVGVGRLWWNRQAERWRKRLNSLVEELSQITMPPEGTGRPEQE